MLYISRIFFPILIIILATVFLVINITRIRKYEIINGKIAFSISVQDSDGETFKPVYSYKNIDGDIKYYTPSPWISVHQNDVGKVKRLIYSKDKEKVIGVLDFTHQLLVPFILYSFGFCFLAYTILIHNQDKLFSLINNFKVH